MNVMNVGKLSPKYHIESALQRAHTGEETCECNEHGKAFAQNSTCNVCQRTYIGQKPYGCNGCGKTITQLLEYITTEYAPERKLLHIMNLGSPKVILCH